MCVGRSLVPDFLRPQGLLFARLLSLWDFNQARILEWVATHPLQGSNWGLLQESPGKSRFLLPSFKTELRHHFLYWSSNCHLSVCLLPSLCYFWALYFLLQLHVYQWKVFTCVPLLPNCKLPEVRVIIPLPHQRQHSGRLFCSPRHHACPTPSVLHCLPFYLSG